MTVSIDGDAAHDAAERELAKPIYPKPSWDDRFWEWVNDTLNKLVNDSAQVPGGGFTVVILVLLAAAAVALAVRIALRTMRTNRAAEPGLFGATELSAAEHRATAEQFAASGNWAAAIRHRLRAVARHLEETGALAAIPGRTASELARDAAALAPDLADQLHSSATIFNEVTYGEQPGSESGYRTVAQLDHQLATRRLGHPSASGADRNEWTPVG